MKWGIRLACLAAAALAPLQAGAASTAPLFQEGWAHYRSTFLTQDGRVVDNANDGVSHSEGQGYAMLLSVLADDRRTFDRIWAWTRKALLVRDDGLAAWRWDPGHDPHVADLNNASDGDLLIAWALAEASRRWGGQEYGCEAALMARALFRVVVIRIGESSILLPGARGFGAEDRPDGPILNSSYFIFPAFEALAPLAPDLDWDGLRASGLRLLAQARSRPAPLPPDWVSLAGDDPAPAKGFAPDFGYNGIRIPLYLAWARQIGEDDLHAALGPFAALAVENGTSGPFVTDTREGRPVTRFHGSGYRLAVALARCITDGTKVPRTLIPGEDAEYYPATLALLATNLLSERYAPCAE